MSFAYGQSNEDFSKFVKNNFMNKQPLTAKEAYLPQEYPLFPREILEPLYEEYIRQNPPYDKTRHESKGFFNFLLDQVKKEIDEEPYKKEKLWKKAFDILLGHGDVYAYDYYATIAQLENEGYRIMLAQDANYVPMKHYAQLCSLLVEKNSEIASLKKVIDNGK